MLSITKIGGVSPAHGAPHHIDDISAFRPEAETHQADFFRVLVDLQGAYSAVGVLRAYTPPFYRGRWVERHWENGLVTVQIHGDAIIATLEQVAATLFIEGGADTEGAPIERALMRRYLFPHLIDHVRKNYGGASPSVQLRQAGSHSEGKA